MLVWQVTEAVLMYRRWPTDTTLTLKFSPRLTFPAISICNMNPIRQSSIFNPKDASEMRDIQETLSMVGIQ